MDDHHIVEDFSSLQQQHNNNRQHHFSSTNCGYDSHNRAASSSLKYDISEYENEHGYEFINIDDYLGDLSNQVGHVRTDQRQQGEPPPAASAPTVPTSVTVTNKGLTTLRAIYGLQTILSPTLVSLSAHMNRLVCIEGLSLCHQLTSLDLSGNLIESMRDGLQGLRSLTYLNLSSNRIRKIEGIQYLQSLVTLILSFNLIKTLEGLAEDYDTSNRTCPGKGVSHTLKSLDLAVNDISDLHTLQYLSRLKSLESLRLDLSSEESSTAFVGVTLPPDSSRSTTMGRKSTPLRGAPPPLGNPICRQDPDLYYAEISRRCPQLRIFNGKQVGYVPEGLEGTSRGEHLQSTPRAQPTSTAQIVLLNRRTAAAHWPGVSAHQSIGAILKRPLDVKGRNKTNCFKERSGGGIVSRLPEVQSMRRARSSLTKMPQSFPHSKHGNSSLSRIDEEEEDVHSSMCSSTMTARPEELNDSGCEIIEDDCNKHYEKAYDRVAPKGNVSHTQPSSRISAKVKYVSKSTMTPSVQFAINDKANDENQQLSTYDGHKLDIRRDVGVNTEESWKTEDIVSKKEMYIEIKRLQEENKNEVQTLKGAHAEEIERLNNNHRNKIEEIKNSIETSLNHRFQDNMMVQKKSHRHELKLLEQQLNVIDREKGALQRQLEDSNKSLKDAMLCCKTAKQDTVRQVAIAEEKKQKQIDSLRKELSRLLDEGTKLDTACVNEIETRQKHHEEQIANLKKTWEYVSEEREKRLRESFEEKMAATLEKHKQSAFENGIAQQRNHQDTVELFIQTEALERWGVFFNWIDGIVYIVKNAKPFFPSAANVMKVYSSKLNSCFIDNSELVARNVRSTMQQTEVISPIGSRSVNTQTAICCAAMCSHLDLVDMVPRKHITELSARLADLEQALIDRTTEAMNARDELVAHLKKEIDHNNEQENSNSKAMLEELEKLRLRVKAYEEEKEHNVRTVRNLKDTISRHQDTVNDIEDEARQKIDEKRSIIEELRAKLEVLEEEIDQSKQEIEVLKNEKLESQLHTEELERTIQARFESEWAKKAHDANISLAQQWSRNEEKFISGPKKGLLALVSALKDQLREVDESRRQLMRDKAFLETEGIAKLQQKNQELTEELQLKERKLEQFQKQWQSQQTVLRVALGEVPTKIHDNILNVIDSPTAISTKIPHIIN